MNDTNSVGTVTPPAMPPTPCGSDQFLMTVYTEPTYYNPGVGLRISVHGLPDDVLSVQSSAYIGVLMSLSPDDADQLAAALVAHAFDFRRRMMGNPARVAAEARGVQA